MSSLEELFGMFENRAEAGRLLAERLKHLEAARPVILALPRGGVVVGDEIALALQAPLDVTVTRKLGAPDNPELAIGAVMEGGAMKLNHEVLVALGIDKDYIEEEMQRQLAEIDRRVQAYRKVRPRVPLKGRVVVLVDDGVATGATMRAAIAGVQAEEPDEVVLAIPVGEASTVDALSEDVDETVVLKKPPFIGGVGQFYEDFSQVSDEEVLEILSRYASSEN